MGSEYLEHQGIPNSRKSISHSNPDLGVKLMNQADLDSSPILKGLPISLARIDIHAEWVSPAILSLLGDLPDTIDGGEIVRDESGKPSGVFVSPPTHWLSVLMLGRQCHWINRRYPTTMDKYPARSFLGNSNCRCGQ
jgi:hypothetical protein